MILNDNFFKKIEQKTNVNKTSIMELAKKLQQNNLKDEKTLKEVIDQLCVMSGKKISKEQEDKIIKTVVNDDLPTNLNQYLD